MPIVDANETSVLVTFPTVRYVTILCYVLEDTWCCRIQHVRAATINMSRKQEFGLVEAQNFVLTIWAPGAEGASGATGYFGSS
jgi:hypothetical protein